LNYDFTASEKRILDIHLLEEWINEAYENAKLFKEKVKIWHDKSIQKRGFKEGHLVLFFNSHFKFPARKLLSKCKRPIMVQQVYHSGALRLRGDIKGKPHVINGQHLKHYISIEKIIGYVEKVYLTSPERDISRKEGPKNRPHGMCTS
jgi:hypothetical protein